MKRLLLAAQGAPRRARWDYRVTITFRNSTLATTSNPDQETYRREERRRFEILLAH